MVKLYDLTKKGTIILTIGRSGSHLLGNIVERQVRALRVPVINLTEKFLMNPPTFSVNAEFFSRIAHVEQLQQNNYVVIQIQDFASKLWFLYHTPDWLNNYHVIILRRRDKISHFFSRQVLLNFWDTIPAHTIRGEEEGSPISFENLRNQKVLLDLDTIWQYYCELVSLDRFTGDETVYYEDMVTWPEAEKSLYLKNLYPVTYEELFENYHDIVKVLNNE